MIKLTILLLAVLLLIWVVKSIIKAFKNAREIDYWNLNSNSDCEACQDSVSPFEQENLLNKKHPCILPKKNRNRHSQEGNQNTSRLFAYENRGNCIRILFRERITWMCIFLFLSIQLHAQTTMQTDKTIHSCSTIKNNSVINSSNPQKSGWLTTNPFKTDLFVKNYGQFDNWLKTDKKIEYVINSADKIFFTNNGLTFEIKKIEKISEEEREEMERKAGGKVDEGEEEENNSKIVYYYVNMYWENCNSNTTIEVSDITEGYYTFGEKGYENIKAEGYKKLTYKNLYKGIDVEYIIPEKGGIKYSLIVQPGADLSEIKMHYSGNINEIKTDKEGNIIISSPAGDIKDHAPQSFYKSSGTNIPSSFLIKDNTVSFHLETRNSKPETLVVDPWTTTPNSLTTNNSAYNVDFDNYGNVYVSGGTPPFKPSKYSNTGALIWTFTFPITWSVFWYSKFCVLQNSGSLFFGEGYNSAAAGTRILKINNA
ncbi:MAG: hypothetical protein PHD97_03510, partial [Bacteroidales bacterium]|nr:hypothetical protein [Bacteroidales bacterium]